jgi:hypothetical protein
MARRAPKRVVGFVPRSGCTVPFDAGDAGGLLDHLKTAIAGDSLRSMKSRRKKSWELVAKEIAAEANHLATTIPPDIAEGLLSTLLHGAAIDRLHEMAKDIGIDAPPATDKIQ